MKLINSKTFELNPQRRVTHQRIGVGKHHVLIIDDVFRYPDIVMIHPLHLSNSLVSMITIDLLKSG